MIDRDVEVQVGEKAYRLSPTLDAMKKINRQFSSIVDCAGRITRYDFDAICFVLAAGAGLSQKQSEQMQREVVAAGLVSVVPSVSKYLGVLLDPEGREEESEESPPGEG